MCRVLQLLKASKKGMSRCCTMLATATISRRYERVMRLGRERSCPADFTGRSTARRLLATPGQRRRWRPLAVIMYCSTSGTNKRALPPPDAPVKARYIPSPWGIARAESGRRAAKDISGELRRSAPASRRAKDVVHADIPEVLITGCRDSQTSADAFLDGRFNGALTFALVQAIRATNGKLTYRELHQRAAAVIKKRKFEQVPQLESRKTQIDLPILSV